MSTVRGAGGRLIFAPGATAQTIGIPTHADDTPEGPETVILHLSAAEDALIGAANPATLTITERSCQVQLPLILSR